MIFACHISLVARYLLFVSKLSSVLFYLFLLLLPPPLLLDPELPLEEPDVPELRLGLELLEGVTPELLELLLLFGLTDRLGVFPEDCGLDCGLVCGLALGVLLCCEAGLTPC